VEEKALRACETPYRRLFESAKDGILILGAKTGPMVASWSTPKGQFGD